MAGKSSQLRRSRAALPLAIGAYVIAAAFSTAGLTKRAAAANWFDTVGSECASNLSTSIVGGGSLSGLTAPTPRTSLSGAPGFYRLIYVLSSSDLPNPTVHYQTTVLTIDQRAKADLATALQNAADRNPLPLFEDVAGFVLSIAPDVVGYTWDIVHGAAKSALNVQPINVEAVIFLLAVGGEITRDTVIQRNQRQELLADLFWYYRVQVGNERRSILLASCRLPVEVRFSIALTHQEFSNKRVESDNQTWRIYDIEDGDYDTPLRYKEQDAEWMYADEVDNSGAVLNRYRISSKDISGEGIAWQTISSGRWRFLSKGLTFE
jgi:hypothetical protein